MIISIHMPKTGGSTFSKLLTYWFADKILFDYEQIIYPGSTAVKPPPWCLCIHGHFFANKYAKLFPDAKLITWLRDPVERVISHYYYWLRHPDMTNPRCLEMIRRNLSLEQFAMMEYFRNYQSRFMSFKKVSDFAFVGITEQFDHSIELFRETFCLKRIKASKTNVNPKRNASHYSIDDNLRKNLENINDKDVKIYNEAKMHLVQEYNRFV